MDRLLKIRRTWLSFICQAAARNLSASRQSDISRLALAGEAVKVHRYSRAQLERLSNSARFRSVFPVLLAGSFVGACFLDTSYADFPGYSHTSSQSGATSNSLPADSGIEKIVRQERERLEEILRGKGMQRGSYPSFIVAAKGPQVSIKFRVPSSCELIHLITDLISHLGQRTDEREGCSEMMFRAWNSLSGRKLTLYLPMGKLSDVHEEALQVVIDKSLTGFSSAEIEFVKQGAFTVVELEALASALKIASVSEERKDWRGSFSERRDVTNNAKAPVDKQSLSSLESMGVKIFGCCEPNEVQSSNTISWDIIAGYDEQKREIEDAILLALTNPQLYDDIARGTRQKFESNRPRAILFEGPPGTGKTSCARVIANQANIPLLYVPLEVVMSKYYGESERLLGTVFTLANDLSSGAIVFLDEVDSFAATRDSEMHEATRRILSVLLRQIDGFEQDKRVVVIAATNRKQDLDPALMSRFDSVITFGLPDHKDRQKIIMQYAKHLNMDELAAFASLSEGMSGRDIRDVCQCAERHWASKIIRGEIPDSTSKRDLPLLEDYLGSVIRRRQTLLDFTNLTDQKPNSHTINQPMAFAS
ncbi:unnamed protein product [Victoria cruziana]